MRKVQYHARSQILTVKRVSTSKLRDHHPGVWGRREGKKQYDLDPGELPGYSPHSRRLLEGGVAQAGAQRVIVLRALGEDGGKQIISEHSQFNKYLLGTYCVSGPVLIARTAAGRKDQ